MRNVFDNSTLHLDDHTLLFVFSPTPQDRCFQLQMDQLAARREALMEHDVVVAEVFEDRHGQMGGDELSPDRCDDLRQQFHIPSGRFRVMLVGRDAHIKMVADSCVSCEEVIMRVENEPQLADVAFE